MFCRRRKGTRYWLEAPPWNNAKQWLALIGSSLLAPTPSKFPVLRDPVISLDAEIECYEQRQVKENESNERKEALETFN